MLATSTATSGSTLVHATADLAEADRLMTVCNSCRYCEGLCAVFPAMEMRRSFKDGDLNYLANLCHGCGACYYDCQFSPPHQFDVNVPKVLAKARASSYARYAWPSFLSGAFERNGLVIALTAALGVAAFIGSFVAWHDPAVLFGVHTGPGAFYRLMPHNTMALLFGVVFLYAMVAIGFGVQKFWCDIGAPPGTRNDPKNILQAIRDARRLHYLDGGGAGCMNQNERPEDQRRFYHHLTFYGFMLCFASTSVATLYHYFLARVAPYPWWDLPVVLGTVGGIGLVIGPIGLLAAKWRRDPMLLREPLRHGCRIHDDAAPYKPDWARAAPPARDARYGHPPRHASRCRLYAVSDTALLEVRARHLSVPCARPLRARALPPFPRAHREARLGYRRPGQGGQRK